MKLNAVIAFSFLVTPLLLFSQKQTNIWYFGDEAGLDFSKDPPTALFDGNLNTNEGCTAVSDENGNLLFYSDGFKIWNASHQIMANSTGLHGHFSSTQSAVIVPKPKSAHIYYIFTVDYQAGPFGLSYSEVNMNLAGGLGAVTSNKNIQLVTPACEKITSVVHQNGRDYWVVIKGWLNDAFYSYLVTPSGVNTTPVISHEGPILGFGLYTSIFNTIGYMKISPDANKLAVAVSEPNSYVEVYDFDNSSGIVSKAVFIQHFTDPGAYGIEFSPNSRFLYVGENGKGVHQFDLDAKNISTSGILAGSTNSTWTQGALQLGPDGRIYLAYFFKQFLGRINNPDVKGTACNFKAVEVNLSPGTSRLGLPSFIQSNLLPEGFIYDNYCAEETTQFELRVPSYDSVYWDFGDSLSVYPNNSTQPDPTHIYTSGGVYTVTLYVYDSSDIDTFHKNIEIFDVKFTLGKDSILCDTNESILLMPDIYNSSYSYIWNDSSSDQDLLISSAGLYWLESTKGRCEFRDSLRVFYGYIPEDLFDDILICKGESLSFNLGAYEGSTVLWHDGTSDPIYSISKEGQYWVEISNSCSTLIDSFEVTHAEINLDLGKDTVLCEGETLLFDVTSFNGTFYEWQDQSNSPKFRIEKEGLYWVKVWNECQIHSDSIYVKYNPKPRFDLGRDTFICESEKVILNAGIDAESYLWSNNSTDSILIVENASRYWLELTVDNCSNRDTIYVLHIEEPFFDLGRDTTICFGGSFHIDLSKYGLPLLWSDNSTSEERYLSAAGTYWVRIKSECSYLYDSISIELENCKCGLFIPNAFTPNNDGENDKFGMYSSCIPDQYHLRIFNRVGEKVFESNSGTFFWDGSYKGEVAATGVYLYIISYKFPSEDAERKTGSINLIR